MKRRMRFDVDSGVASDEEVLAAAAAAAAGSYNPNLGSVSADDPSPAPPLSLFTPSKPTVSDDSLTERRFVGTSSRIRHSRAITCNTHVSVNKSTNAV